MLYLTTTLSRTTTLVCSYLLYTYDVFLIKFVSTYIKQTSSYLRQYLWTQLLVKLIIYSFYCIFYCNILKTPRRLLQLAVQCSVIDCKWVYCCYRYLYMIFYHVVFPKSIYCFPKGLSKKKKNCHVFLNIQFLDICQSLCPIICPKVRNSSQCFLVKRTIFWNVLWLIPKNHKNSVRIEEISFNFSFVFRKNKIDLIKFALSHWVRKLFTYYWHC